MSSAVKEALEAFVAGRAKAERVVVAVATAYYGEAGRGMRDGLRPLIEVIERAHPGVVELAGSTERPGFSVRLAERPFPKALEPDLLAAAKAVLAQQPAAAGSPAAPGLWSRVVTAVRRLFNASA